MGTKMHHGAMEILESELAKVAEALYDGGMVLMPTDTVWSAVVLLNKPQGVAKLEGYLPAIRHIQYPELLVRNAEEAKQYVTHLHPRLETLWTYHVRPLSILFDNPLDLPSLMLHENGGEVAIRVVTDDFSQRLIEMVGLPLVALPAISEQEHVALTFNQVSSKLLGAVDYTVQFRRKDNKAGELPVVVRFDDHEELEFIRE